MASLSVGGPTGRLASGPVAGPEARARTPTLSRISVSSTWASVQSSLVIVSQYLVRVLDVDRTMHVPEVLLLDDPIYSQTFFFFNRSQTQTQGGYSWSRAYSRRRSQLAIGTDGPSIRRFHAQDVRYVDGWTHLPLFIFPGPSTIFVRLLLWVLHVKTERSVACALSRVPSVDVYVR